MKDKNIVICMGSSCFSRGNNKSLAIIKKYLSENNIESEIKIIGMLCEQKCTIGPYISIFNQGYTKVSPSAVVDILNYHFSNKE